jgi:hypothetical protein
MLFYQYKPYFRFVLPQLLVNPEEDDIWSKLKAGEIPCIEAIEKLSKLKEDKHIKLTPLSNKLIVAPLSERASIVECSKNVAMKNTDFITCMSKINFVTEDERALQCLVIGTESCIIHIYDSIFVKEHKQIKINSVPHRISCYGTYDTTSTLVASCRNMKVYVFKNIKDAEAPEAVIDMDCHIINTVVLDNMYAVATISNTLLFYSINKREVKKSGEIQLNHQIICMELLELKHTQTLTAILVALDNNELRLYQDRTLIHVIQLEEHVLSLIFGSYGREEGALILNFKAGGLAIKMLQRQAKLQVYAI